MARLNRAERFYKRAGQPGKQFSGFEGPERYLPLSEEGIAGEIMLAERRDEYFVPIHSADLSD